MVLNYLGNKVKILCHESVLSIWSSTSANIHDQKQFKSLMPDIEMSYLAAPGVQPATVHQLAKLTTSSYCLLQI